VSASGFGVEPDDLRARVEAFGEERQVLGAASDLENPMARPDPA
jgi:hypothetical protein